MILAAVDREAGCAAITVNGRLAAVIEESESADAALAEALDVLVLSARSVDLVAEVGDADVDLIDAAIAFYPSGFDAAICRWAVGRRLCAMKVRRGGSWIPLDAEAALDPDGELPLCLGRGVSGNWALFDSLRGDGRVVFPSPFCGAGARAVGTAFLKAAELGDTVWQVSTPFLGRSLGAEALATLSAKAGFALRGCDDPIARAVDRLVAGEPVGWIQGRQECGPLARGGWSLLIPPQVARDAGSGTLVTMPLGPGGVASAADCFVQRPGKGEPSGVMAQWRIDARSSNNELLWALLRRSGLPWLLLQPLALPLEIPAGGRCRTVIALDHQLELTS